MLVPGTASALEVECSNDDGTCSVSNDGMDWESCSCAGGGGTGGTGGNNYAGLGVGELNAICLGLLEFCAGFESEVGTDTFMTTSVGTVTDTEADTSDSFSTTDPVTSDATESASTTDHSTSDPTDVSATEQGTTTDEPPGSTSDDTDGEGTTGDGTTGDGTTSNAQPTATDPTTTPVDDASAEDSSGGEGGADSEQSGCGCTAGPGDPVAALGLFALLGLRRRARAGTEQRVLRNASRFSAPC